VSKTLYKSLIVADGEIFEKQDVLGPNISSLNKTRRPGESVKQFYTQFPGDNPIRQPSTLQYPFIQAFIPTPRPTQCD